MPSPRKRIMIHKPGSYNALRIDDTPIDNPQKGEVQVEVKACGINFADIAVRLGLYSAARGQYPICPGFEFSGMISQVGSSVKDFKPGSNVFGAAHFGAYTSAINCPADQLWRLPDSWSFSKGASFPVAYLTAYYALYSMGHLQKSDKVLIHSAAGGVGTALLHLLKINGNFSVGVVGRTEKAAAAKKAGAGFVIDKSREKLWKKAKELCPDGYDVILDANGASTLKGSYMHLKPAGRLLTYGFASMFSHNGRRNFFKLIWYYFRTPRFNPINLTMDNKSVCGFNLVYLFDKVDLFQKIMGGLLKYDSAGKIPPMPIKTFPFDKVADAHRQIENGNSIGKIVLVN